MSKPIQGLSLAFVCTALLMGTACPTLAQPTETAHPAAALSAAANGQEVLAAKVKNPASIDWSKSRYIFPRVGSPVLVYDTGNSAYMVAAEAAGVPKKGTRAFEVVWAHGKTVKELENILNTAIGYPTGAARWKGNVSSQNFSGGKVTWQKGGGLSIKLNLQGAKVAARDYRTGGKLFSFSGNFTKISKTTYAEKGQDLVLLFDTRSGSIGAVTPRVYEEYRKNPGLFGAIIGYHDSGEGRYGLRNRISYFERGKDERVHVREVGKASLRYEVYKSGELVYRDYVDRDSKQTQINPDSVDWSEGVYTPIPGLPDDEGGALYLQDGDDMIIIKATADGKPAPGAKAYHCPWLGRSATRWTLHHYSEFDLWSHRIWDTINQQAVLGAPIAQAQTVVEEGVTYSVQRFENGSVKWKLPLNPFTGRIDPFAGKHHFNESDLAGGEITLDPQAQAAYEAWKKENSPQW